MSIRAGFTLPAWRGARGRRSFPPFGRRWLETSARRGHKGVWQALPGGSVTLTAIVWVIFFPLLSGLDRAHPQDFPGRHARLSENYFKSGAVTLRAFAPVAKLTRDSVVQIEIDGSPAALGTVIEGNGLVLTKASELRPGKLTALLANGRKTDGKVVANDDENDLALVQLKATGLKPIKWAPQEITVGQWAVTPGVGTLPEAVGIVSVPPRKIFHKRAFIGVQLDFNSSGAKISQITPGLGADKAGLKPGDMIVAVNENPVSRSEQLSSTLREFRLGQTVKLRVRRNEEEFEARVEMGAMKPERPWRGADRQERMNRLGGELSQRAEGFELAIQHDTVLQPWQCGGPLVNLEGKAIGLNIARAGRAASYALPPGLVKQVIADLKYHVRTTVKQETARSTAN